MAGSFGTKLSLTQTSINVAGGIVGQYIASGQFKPESTEELLKTIFDIADGVAEKLEAVRQEELSETPQQSTYTPRGGGQFGARGNDEPEFKADPTTFVLGEQFKKHAGKTMAQAFAADPAYVKWLAFSSKAKTAKAVATEFLTSKGIAA